MTHPQNSRTARRIAIGEFGTTVMPYSEVCMSMGKAGKVMRFKLLTERDVQLYNPDTQQAFSFPILPGEAGLFTDKDGFYYYPVS